MNNIIIVFIHIFYKRVASMADSCTLELKKTVMYIYALNINQVKHGLFSWNEKWMQNDIHSLLRTGMGNRLIQCEVRC